MFLIVALIVSSMGVLPLVKGEPTITVKGKLMTHHAGNDDQHGDSFPVRNARIEVYDEEIFNYPFAGWAHLPWPDELIKTVYTDDNGAFSFSINNNDGSTIIGDEGGRDIYLKVIASNDHSEVLTNPSWLFGGKYEFQVATKRDVADGGVADFGTFYPDTADKEVAFEILSNIELAWRLIRSETGESLDKVRTFYRDSFATPSGVSYCLPDKIADYLEAPIAGWEPDFPDWVDNILGDLRDLPFVSDVAMPGFIRAIAGLHFTKVNLVDWTNSFYDTVFHEYGHYVMNELFDLGPPFTKLGDHYIDEVNDPYHAWVEGWAEFFSSVARQEFAMADPTDLGGGYDIESSGLTGNNVEGAIAGLLWDVYDDTPNEDLDNEPFHYVGDNLHLSFGEICEVITNYDPAPNWDQVWPAWADHPWRIEHFFSAFQAAYRNDPDAISDLWNTLRTYDIEIEDTTPPNNPTSYISKQSPIAESSYKKISVDLLGANDNLSGIKKYSYNWEFRYEYVYSEHSLEDINTYWDDSTKPHIELQEASEGDWYLLVTTFDNADNWAGEIFVAGPITVHETPILEFDGAITNQIGQLVLGSDSQVEINPPPPTGGKIYQPFLKITDIPDEQVLPFSQVLNFLDKSTGYYEIKIYELEGPTKTAVAYSYQLLLDKTSPTIQLLVGEPKWGDNWVTSNTPFTITANDADAGVKSIKYSFDGANWIEYSNPFRLLGKPDASYTIYYRAEDYVGNVVSETTTVQLDNSVPTFEMIIDSPKVTLDKTHVTSDTAFSISSSDRGCGLDQVEYRLVNTGSGWASYSSPFTIIGSDDDYTIDYRCSDKLGNTQTKTLTVVLDNSGPQISIISPSEGFALQDVLDIKVDSQDPSGVADAKLSISGEAEFSDLTMSYDSEFWAIELNTFKLDDGDYVFEIFSTDGLGNSETITASYSIRNGALISLLPSTEKNNAGRTMPIKFTLRVSADVDPAQPFVYNENLVIQIFQDGVVAPLQVSTFGGTSTDYRINIDTELYITNFATLKKTAATYSVEVFGGGLPVDVDSKIDDFTFYTTKN